MHVNESNAVVATSAEISNEAFIWSRVFETGLPDVDKQHQVLVRLINQLGAREPQLLCLNGVLNDGYLERREAGLGREYLLMTV